MTQPRTLIPIVCALSLAVLTAPAFAGAGAPDPAFDERARPTVDTPSSGKIKALAVRPDGRIVAASYRPAPAGGTDVVVHQLLPDGSPDRSFDGDGVAILDTGRSDDVNGVAVRPDGKIVVLGTSGPLEGRNVIVYRLAPNGALDPTFDGDGVAAVDNGHDEVAAGLALRPDGRIVVAATATDHVAGTADVAVYRLRADGGTGALNGALAPTFDGDGAAGVDSGEDETAKELALRPDGGIVVGGFVTAGLREHASVYVLKQDGGPGGVNGALDPTFDTDGAAAMNAGGRSAATGLAVLADGRILVGGQTSSGPTATYDAIVWRLKRDGGTGALNGALDESFDGDGVAYRHAGGSETIQAFGVQPDGKIVLAGDSYRTTVDAVAFRLLPSGAPDLSFGDRGAAIIDEGRIEEHHAVAFQPDRGILLGGVHVVAGSDRRALHRVFGDPFALRVEVSGPGSVVSDPAGIDCGAQCALELDAGAWRTLTARPDEGAVFTGWSGGGCSGTGPCSVTLRGDTLVRATFAAAPVVSEPAVAETTPQGRDDARPLPRLRFGARTNVTARRVGRGRLRLINRNTFAVSVRVGPRTVTLRANSRRVMKLRGRIRSVRATDPSGATRIVRVRPR